LKIATIIGARPQFVKASVVSRALLRLGINETLIHTGQHYDENMSQVFFEELGIPKPTYRFELSGKTHGEMTAEILVNCEKVLNAEKPDILIVYGDTNSTLAGALAASKLHIPIAHIEAGLRSFNNKMPEEINRILTDRISTLLFCPTDEAVKNLKSEGIVNGVFQIGDVMQDVALEFGRFAKKPDIETEDRFLLCTIHRAENTDDESRLKSIFEALNKIAKDSQIILPLHPRTAKKLASIGEIDKHLKIIEPVPFFEMVWLLKNCDMVLTDSGGVQKEAYFHSKPCVTLRDETEWVETLEHNYNILAGADSRRIIDACKHDFNPDYSKKLYGDGDAAEKIVKNIVGYPG